MVNFDMGMLITRVAKSATVENITLGAKHLEYYLRKL